jgi:hypothetical protein
VTDIDELAKNLEALTETDLDRLMGIVGTEHRPNNNHTQNFSGDNPAAVQITVQSEMKQTILEGNRRWQSDGDHFWSANLTLDTLPAGLYRAIEKSSVGPTLEKMNGSVDDLIDFTDSPSASVIAEIRQFWELAPEFEKRGFIHKRGVLLWGAPGSGKTSTLQQLISIVVKEHEGIAIFLDNPHIAAGCLQMVRRIEPNRPIVAMLEDIDALIAQYCESSYLSLLDGETQVANIVFVATTNYPEKLDPRFIDRPSRFDILREIAMPSANIRATFLRIKEPNLPDDEVAEWVRRSDGYSIAHLREMIILCRCYGKTLDEAIKRMDILRERAASSRHGDDGRSSDFGFIKKKHPFRTV